MYDHSVQVQDPLPGQNQIRHYHDPKARLQRVSTHDKRISRALKHVAKDAKAVGKTPAELILDGWRWWWANPNDFLRARYPGAEAYPIVLQAEKALKYAAAWAEVEAAKYVPTADEALDGLAQPAKVEGDPLEHGVGQVGAAGVEGHVEEAAADPAVLTDDLLPYLASTTFVQAADPAIAKFRDWFDFHEPVATMPSHRALALLRGRNEGVLLLTLDVERSDPDAAQSYGFVHF